jgi:quercetin dioxygenase-like cupin family protein
MLTKRNLVCAICAALGFAAVAHAESVTPPISRVTLQTTELADGKVFIQQRLEGKPNLRVPRHTHPGIESSYVLSGSLILSVRGEPDRLVKAGDSFLIPAGVPHGGRIGPDGLRSLGTFIVEKDKPLLSPTPE